MQEIGTAWTLNNGAGAKRGSPLGRKRDLRVSILRSGSVGLLTGLSRARTWPNDQEARPSLRPRRAERIDERNLALRRPSRSFRPRRSLYRAQRSRSSPKDGTARARNRCRRTSRMGQGAQERSCQVSPSEGSALGGERRQGAAARQPRLECDQVLKRRRTRPRTPLPGEGPCRARGRRQRHRHPASRAGSRNRTLLPQLERD